MRRKAVESSNIASIGYKVRSKTLEVRFKNGAVYQYFNVPKEVHEGFQEAESTGKYFHELVRNSFQYERIK